MHINDMALFSFMTICLDSELLIRVLYTISVVLKLQHASEPPGVFVKHRLLDPRFSSSIGMGRGGKFVTSFQVMLILLV